jgi:hypothetical protein
MYSFPGYSKLNWKATQYLFLLECKEQVAHFPDHDYHDAMYTNISKIKENTTSVCTKLT